MICTVKDSDKGGACSYRCPVCCYWLYDLCNAVYGRCPHGRGVPAIKIKKISDGSPNALDLILDGEVDLVIDTPTQGHGMDKTRDGFLIRRNAIETGVTCLTSLDTAKALLTSIESENMDTLTVVDIASI